MAALLASALLPLASAQAGSSRVLLRVLVVSNGDPSADAIATQLDREGVPYTKVAVGSAGRPVIDAAFLAEAATGTANFQAVVLPNQAGGGLGADEVAALTAYERAYGVRQVSAYDYPGATMGFSVPTYAGSLDGVSATVTAAGRAGPFAYLRGALPIDDFSPTLEVYGYLAAPAATLPAGESFTPFLTASAGDSDGVLAGVYARDGREELVLTAAYNPSMQWFNELAPGIVTWLTRGIHLGYQRNYFAVHVDDVFLPDSRWSVSANCTPGDDCVDQAVTTPDIRMTPADVTRLTEWQAANAFALDMVYNGGGSDAAVANTGSDPLTDAFLAVQGQFPWINHTYTHPYLGCIQIAPTVVGQSWHCATTEFEAPRQDPEVPQTFSGGIYWASQAFLGAQIADNAAWGTAHGLTNFDATELVTGEHSGLRNLPQQPADNPFLAPALTDLGVKFTASDASREPVARVVGTTTTVPRHPMNIYYNTATYQEQIDEYNWYYTNRAAGGSGICEDNPATSTCIAPLPAANAASSRASYDSYLQPLEVRNALRYVLTNDVAPFYAHQSNLAEDGILYPVVTGVLDAYRAVYNAATTPVVNLDMTGLGQVDAAMTAWKASAGVQAYVDGEGVHVPAGATSVPLTVPAGTAVTGATLAPYGGELSGWTTGPVTAVPPVAAGGYVSVPLTPNAPTLTAVSAGDAAATLTWAAPADNGTGPVTGYIVRAFAAGADTPAATLTAPAGATSVAVTGLTNGSTYTLDVAAVNSFGTGTFSARSAAVTPLAPPTVPGAPTIGVPVPGNASATVRWTAPGDGGSALTGYTVRVFAGTAAAPVQTVAVASTATSVTVVGLTNAVAYTFDVAASNIVGVGPFSARSIAVTPVATAAVPGAPTIGVPTRGDASAVVRWTAPAVSGSSAITGYRVRVYVGGGSAVLRTVTAVGQVTSVTVTGLTNGTAYSFDVAAINAVGTGASSARSAAVTPATVPGAPAIGLASSGIIGGSATATARWSPPASTGGSAITGYRVTAQRVSLFGSILGTTTSAVLPATSRSLSMTLPAVASYRFTVQAINAVGAGAQSARSNQVVGW